MFYIALGFLVLVLILVCVWAFIGSRFSEEGPAELPGYKTYTNVVRKKDFKE